VQDRVVNFGSSIWFSETAELTVTFVFPPG